jgi:hypothetical protein
MWHRTLLLAEYVVNILIAGENLHSLTKQIPLNDQREVEINIEFNTGKLWMASTETSLILDGDFLYKTSEPIIDYQDGALDIYTDDKGKDKKREVNITLDSFSDIKENEWRLKFGEAAAYSFNIEMGAADAQLDFSNLKIKNLKIASGASKIVMHFSQPNPVRMATCEIEAGVSKFTAFDLLNANFDNFNFEGGVGDYELFFTGSLQRKAIVEADVSLGSLTIYVPNTIAYRVDCDKSLLCSFSVENASKQNDNIWYSDNFQKKDAFLDFNLNAGIGVVSIQRIKD